MMAVLGLFIHSQTSPIITSTPILFEQSESALFAVHSGLQNASAYRKWTSDDRKLELQIPSHWHVASKEENLDSRAALEAISGELISDRYTLIRIRSSKESHYAALNFSANPEASLSQEAFASATLEDLAPIVKEVRDTMEQKQESMGIKLISHEDPRFIRIGRLRAFLMGYTYRRNGQTQPWTVQVIGIPSQYALYQFVTTWNKEREPVAKPILDHVVQSLIIR